MAKGSLIKLINGCGLTFRLRATTVTLRVNVSTTIEFLHSLQEHDLLTVDRVKFKFLLLESLCLYAHVQDQSYAIWDWKRDVFTLLRTINQRWNIGVLRERHCDRRPFSLFREKQKHHRVTVTLGLKPFVTRPYRVS